MNQHDPNARNIALHLRRSFNAPRQVVFDFWTRPEFMVKWFCPSSVFSVPNAEADLRSGGDYAIQMCTPEGELLTVGGTYREVKSPEKLVFTWGWKDGKSCDADTAATSETLVTVEFYDLGGVTEVVLTHERFPDEETKAKHTHGWEGCLTHLASKLKQSLAPGEFRMKLKFNAPVEKLFAAIASKSGIQDWWTRFTEGNDQTGGTLTMRFPKSDFFAQFQVTACEPNKFIEWKCLDGEHPKSSGYANRKDWIGTTVRFEMSAVDGAHSELRFAHFGLAPLECSVSCTNGWSFFLNESLRAYLETGKGDPSTE